MVSPATRSGARAARCHATVRTKVVSDDVRPPDIQSIEDPERIADELLDAVVVDGVRPRTR